jgi:signal transduction histidine kinase
MSFTDDQNSSGAAAHFTALINNINAGVWEYEINANTVKWSDGFYHILGYQPGEIECSQSFFYDHLIYHGDKKQFIKSLNDRSPGHASTVQVRLLTKESGYQWFENTSRKSNDEANPTIYGSFININTYKLAELEASQKEFFFTETTKIAKVAMWELDVRSMNFTLSDEGYDIIEISAGTKISVEELTGFFDSSARQAAAEAIDNIVQFSKSFDLELPFRTAKNKTTWVKFKAIPIIDDYGKCTHVRGVIQDIDSTKKRETVLQSSLNLSTDQNKRLQNFAYIVSHNLRSHTGNLEFMVNLFNESDTQEEKDEVFEHIRSIAKNLKTTVTHLDEVVRIQTEPNKNKTLINFEEVFKSIMDALYTNIRESNAHIEYDFSKCPEVEYIPAYLDSILQNMLTNAIKYRQKGIDPVIKCNTFRMNKHVYLIFEDNGMGIDMAKHGDQVFGMYKTFHQNNDAKGIGLFITRNQIESLGGTIKVESAVNQGTKFTIRLT